MEQHPIPQNVTTFQFRLIGDMTIKQFGYLAGGLILAYVCYKLPLPFFFTWPLAIVSALLGFGLAFVPVEERPMDIWIMAFIKNVYNPTQYVWQKKPPSKEVTTQPVLPLSGGKSAQSPAEILSGVTGGFSDALSSLLPKTKNPAPVTPKGVPAMAPEPKQASTRAVPAVAAVPASPAPSGLSPESLSPVASNRATLTVANIFGSRKPEAAKGKQAELSAVLTANRSAGPFDWLFNLFKPKPKEPRVNFSDSLNLPPIVKSATPRPTDQTPAPDTTKTESVPSPLPISAEQEHISVLERNLENLKKELDSKNLSEVRILELQKQLSEVLSQKDKLEKEVVTLRQTMRQQPVAAPVFRPAGVSVPAQRSAPTVRVLMPDVAKKAGLPRLTTFPNIVTGIVKDGTGNLLAGILVTVRDKNDIPLRALKTNKLGQFAASTPLPNGTYLIEIEDPRGNFVFDRVQVALSGLVMPALEIFAKSQKQLERDKLAREIFGGPKV